MSKNKLAKQLKMNVPKPVTCKEKISISEEKNLGINHSIALNKLIC